MKKLLTLPALLLTAAMLVACDSGTIVVPGKTTDSTTDSPVLAAPTSESAAAETTLPAPSSAPVSAYVPVIFPTLYQTPEITAAYDDVVPAPTIETIVEYDETKRYSIPYNFPLPEDLLYYLEEEECNYIIALVTPLELNSAETHFRLAIEHIYTERFNDENIRTVFYDMINSIDTTDIDCSSRQYNSKLSCYKNEIPITTTGGKYVVLLALRGLILCGEDGCTHSYCLSSIPLTWELDMANVPGSTGDDWNRPPYIGKAEYYYAFGFGDVWERYMAK